MANSTEPQSSDGVKAMDKNQETEYWLFNTDETEPEGEGKHASMLKNQVVAAWGYCKGLGAEATLNRPQPGDVVYYFRARHGIIARAVANDVFSSPSQAVFGEQGEYTRPVDGLKTLPESAPLTVADIKKNTGYQIPYRQIMGRIPDEPTIEYLNRKFRRLPAKARRAGKKSSSGSPAFFKTDPAERKKVEIAAVRVVTKIYEKARWRVRSVERENIGYDLHCTKGDLVECVEVKGTSGDQERFMITANELNKAKSDPGFVLFVVTNALKKPVSKQYTGKQLLKMFDIQPIQFRASLCGRRKKQ